MSWYVDGLGFVVLFTLPGPDGPALVHLRHWPRACCDPEDGDHGLVRPRARRTAIEGLFTRLSAARP